MPDSGGGAHLALMMTGAKRTLLAKRAAGETEERSKFV